MEMERVGWDPQRLQNISPSNVTSLATAESEERVRDRKSDDVFHLCCPSSGLL